MRWHDSRRIPPHVLGHHLELHQLFRCWLRWKPIVHAAISLVCSASMRGIARCSAPSSPSWAGPNKLEPFMFKEHS